MVDPKTVKNFNELMRIKANTLGGGVYQGTEHTTGRRDMVSEVFGKDVNMTAKMKVVFTTPTDPTKEIKPLITEEQWNALISEIGIAKLDDTVRNQAMGMFNNLIEKVIDMKAHNRNILNPTDANFQSEFQQLHDTLQSFIEPTALTKFLAKVKTVVNKILAVNIKKAFLSVKKIKDTLTKYTGSLLTLPLYSATYLGARAIFGKLPVLLGPVPIKHANYVEVARSGKVLKFRATGSVFLALQEGGADAIRIEGTLYKGEFFVMFMLWGLFLYGQSRFKELEALSPTSLTSVTEVRKMNDLLVTNESKERPSYEYHQTFPFVSRHFIIPHCFIETISIEDKLPLKDTLKFTILIRTYEKPQGVCKFVSGDKTMYGTSKKGISAEICDFSLNAGWRLMQSLGIIAKDQEWKIGSATEEGVLDTYYDINWADLTSATYLSMMGAMT